MGKELMELVYQLDDATGTLATNKESLKSLRIELARIRESGDKTKQDDVFSMGLTFRDIIHKIIILDDLLTYVMNDFDKNFDQMCEVTKLLQKHTNVDES